MEKGYGVIAPSRPGWGRSDMIFGFDQQADQMALLLDALDIKQVAAVYGISGGGPISQHFAARHPDRVKCMVLECTASGSWKEDLNEEKKLMSSYSKFFATNISIARLGAKVGVKASLTEMIKGGATYGADKERVAMEVQENLNDPRRVEVSNAVIAFNAIFQMYPSCFEALRWEFVEYKKAFPLSDVKIPTQITHGNCDGTVPFENG